MSPQTRQLSGYETVYSRLNVVLVIGTFRIACKQVSHVCCAALAEFGNDSGTFLKLSDGNQISNDRLSVDRERFHAAVHSGWILYLDVQHFAAEQALYREAGPGFRYARIDAQALDLGANAKNMIGRREVGP